MKFNIIMLLKTLKKDLISHVWLTKYQFLYLSLNLSDAFHFKIKKDFMKVHLRVKSSLNQQLSLKGNPGEIGLFTNMGTYMR